MSSNVVLESALARLSTAGGATPEEVKRLIAEHKAEMAEKNRRLTENHGMRATGPTSSKQQ